MNFVKGRDEFKKFGACFIWFAIIFVSGALVSYYIAPKFIKSIGHAIAFGWCCWILTLILSSSIKSIKVGNLDATISKTDISPDKAYKVYYYGIGPYVANRLKISYPDKLHNCKEYHACEIKVYETIANRRFWNVFCPFIETETLTVEEIEDIIQSCK